MVEPPCRQLPLSMRTLNERATPIGSTPMWLRNLLSSTAIIAARMVGGISSYLSQRPKLGPSETSSVPSAARTRTIWPRSDRRDSCS